MPSSGGVSPRSVRTIVLLPDPFGPTTPRISPLATVSDRFLKSGRLGYPTVRSRDRNTHGSVMA